MIITPVHWYHVSTTLKAMMDRLVCADGGNPDPSSTHGKTVAEAKALELEGWPYPRHLAGRHFGGVVHGDAVGAETLRRSLSDWLTDMMLISAGRFAKAHGYIGYMEPYSTSHEALDADHAFQKETENAARTRQCGQVGTQGRARGSEPTPCRSESEMIAREDAWRAPRPVAPPAVQGLPSKLVAAPCRRCCSIWSPAELLAP
jgi:hypothetical protein